MESNPRIEDMNLIPLPSLFDIGVNLTSGSFKERSLEVLSRASSVGVNALIAIASDEDESKLLSALPPITSPQVWITAGIHPHQAKSFDRKSLGVIEQCFMSDRCVAIGECGLDYNRMYSPKQVQLQTFEAQARLARNLDAPLYLHERDAHTDFVSILRATHPQSPVDGVIHCFTGDRARLKTYLELGLYVGITGWVCDERRGEALRDALRYIPEDRLLLETDAPYLRPRSYKGPLRVKGNEPCLLPHIAEAVAGLLGRSITSLANSTTRNARRLFRLK